MRKRISIKSIEQLSQMRWVAVVHLIEPNKLGEAATFHGPYADESEMFDGIDELKTNLHEGDAVFCVSIDPKDGRMVCLPTAAAEEEE